MIKKMKHLMIIFFALSSFFIVYGSFAKPVDAAAFCPIGQAQVWNGSAFECKGKATETDTAKKGNIDKTKEYFRYTAVAIAGISLAVSVLMIAYAGFLYTVSEGDAEKVKKAKFHVITAGGGMMISGLSFVIYGILDTIMK